MATLPRSELPDAELDNSPTDLMVLVDTSMSGGTLQARQAAEEFVEKHQAEPTERRVEIYADLANRFAFHGELDIGQQFFQQAIDLNTDSNKEYHLLSSFAVWTSGPMRLRYLSQAADLNPQKSIQLNVQLQMLLNELRVKDLKLLKELIDAAGRRSVQTELIVKQAELIIDDTEAAKVVKELFEKQRIYTREQIKFIPDWRKRLFYEKREDWALRLLTRGGEHAYVIGHFENRLRNGERLDISSLRILADAYQIDGQRVNENRARIGNDSAAGHPQMRSPGFF